MSDAPKRASKGSLLWLVALPLAVTLAGVGLWQLTRGATPTRRVIPADNQTTSSPDLVKIAVQSTDVPQGFHQCTSSGNFVSYMFLIKAARPQLFEANQARWNALRAQGATDAYIAQWGDSDAACDGVIRGVATGPVVFSLIVTFPTPDQAVAAYKADLFQQTSFRSPDADVKEGDPSGLGPNAISAIRSAATPPTHFAYWQSHAVNVLFGSQYLTAAQSEPIMSAVNHRIPQSP